MGTTLGITSAKDLPTLTSIFRHRPICRRRSLPAKAAEIAQAHELAPPAAQVPPPDSANDYLYAHQGYSPRNSLQGVAPYVRTVSGQTRPGK